MALLTEKSDACSSERLLSPASLWAINKCKSKSQKDWCFNRSGARLASAGSDKVVRLWEPGSAVQTSSLRGMMDSITDLAFTSDQDHIIAAGSDKSLRLWDIGSGRERHTLTGHSDKVGHA